MRSLYLLLLCTLVLVCGCAVTQVQRFPPKITDIDFPPLDEIVQREVGETMVDQGHIAESEAYEFLQDVEYVRNSLFRVRVASGAKFMAKTIDGQKWYCGPSKVDTTMFQQGVWHDLGACIVKVDDKVIEYTGVGVKEVAIPPSMIRETTVWEASKGNFQKQLLYTGKTGATIHLSYREFLDSMARPAFTQDLIFDLNDGNVIGFRGARFEIIEASNLLIKYKMISKFSN